MTGGFTHFSQHLGASFTNRSMVTSPADVSRRTDIVARSPGKRCSYVGTSPDGCSQPKCAQQTLSAVSFTSGVLLHLTFINNVITSRDFTIQRLHASRTSRSSLQHGLQRF